MYLFIYLFIFLLFIVIRSQHRYFIGQLIISNKSFTYWPYRTGLSRERDRVVQTIL